MNKKFRLGSLKGRDYSEDLGVDGREILKWVMEIGFWVWIGFILLSLEAGGELL
jgi:hypothetical protein